MQSYGATVQVIFTVQENFRGCPKNFQARYYICPKRKPNIVLGKLNCVLGKLKKVLRKQILYNPQKIRIMAKVDFQILENNKMKPHSFYGNTGGNDGDDLEG